LRIREQFIKTYNDYLNEALASTLLNLRQELIKIKTNLLNELRSDLTDKVASIIDNNYEAYHKNLERDLDNFIQSFYSFNNITIFLNNRDYQFFAKKSTHFKDKFGDSISLINSKGNFLGGFRASLDKEKITIDNTIENEISKKSTFIENEFSKIFSEERIRDLSNNFEHYILKKKEQIQEYLDEYDRIG
jgi:vacuolar-type H+-ATPase subunit E/Vma4